MKEKGRHFSEQDRASRFYAATAFLVLMTLAGMVLSLCSGSVKIEAANIFKMCGGAAKAVAQGIFSGGLKERLNELTFSSTSSAVFFGIRLPRVVLSALLGGALAVSGWLLQVFFRNPIAGPFVLGISSGAKTAVGITLVFIAKSVSLSPVSLITAAFSGALFVTLLVLLFSQKVKSMAQLLIVGVMVGYVCSALTDLCITFASEHDVVNLTNWSQGSFSGSSGADVKTAFFVCLPALFCALLLSKPMGAYALGEGYAKSVGVSVLSLRAALILVSSILSACVTALAGPVSFVGVAVPHIARSILKSAKPAQMTVVSFFCGAAFCVLCDLAARILFAPLELNIGTVTSVVGAPVVISVMLKSRRMREE